MSCFAHTLPDRPPSEWEPLFTPFGSGPEECQGATCEKCATLTPYHGHLNKVAWWTAKFAAAMFPPGLIQKAAWHWGYLAGLWHDLGKFHPAFGRKLHGERIQIEHAGAGAALAQQRGMPGWQALAFAIAGHHCGLANSLNRETQRDVLTALSDRLKQAPANLQECMVAGTPEISEVLEVPFAKHALPAPIISTPVADSSFIRMLFSALVDADSLATEAFCAQAETRPHPRTSLTFSPIERLQHRLDTHMDTFAASCETSDINRERARILAWCREAADTPPGFFQMNVPTGGGKTLAAMAFALRHAARNASLGMRRVVVAVPYTSIIEQNAGIYSDILGAENVIEHHSNIDDFADGGIEGGDERAIRHRLACENWDAPILVTTNVQLFESLFAHKRRRARKLHNLAGSVIILDEAQCVPAEYLELILSALRDLVENYGCSVVVSTATQPAWKERRKLPFGIPPDHMRPIIPLEVELAKLDAFARVEIEWPASLEPTSHEELADPLAEEPCVMAIVHRKKDARILARRLKELRPAEKVFHLSTNMCPAHRRQMLAEIRTALRHYREEGTPCRVVSTQLVEAGIDLDFPVIFRALAGLDSIAQAAGRCNRENRLSGKGRVVVFIAETEPPDSHLKHCAEVTQKMLEEKGGSLDLCDAGVFEEFFIRLYRDRNLDARNLVRHARDLNFETLGREFRLIEDGDQSPIVVLFDDEARKRLKRIEDIATRADGSTAARVAFRALQPYTVLVRPAALQSLRPALRPLFERSLTSVLDPDFYTHSYDPIFGLSTDDEPAIPPSRLIVE